MSRFLKVYPSKKRRKKIITILGYTQYIKKWLDWSFGSCSVGSFFVFVSYERSRFDAGFPRDFVQVMSRGVEVSCLICDFEICHLFVRRVD